MAIAAKGPASVLPAAPVNVAPRDEAEGVDEATVPFVTPVGVAVMTRPDEPARAVLATTTVVFEQEQEVSK